MYSWRIKDPTQPDYLAPYLQEDWMRAMAGAVQDPIHHAEGDVLTHVSWVCRELTALDEYRRLPADEQQVLAWAALLHDVAKPECTVHEGDRVRSPSHAERGARKARKILWFLNCPFEIREQICSLVRYHMTVFWALERDDPIRLARQISLHCRCDHLALLAQADALGRACADTQDLLDKVALFRELASEAGCLKEPMPFASPTARFRYFQGKWHNPELEPWQEFRSRVIVMAGLPGAGKDTWIARYAPPWSVISLDALRQELKIAPTGPQGKVLEVARERARQYLRAGEPFIWNATNISRSMRQKPISLFLEYGAQVRIQYVEVPPLILEHQNRNREAPVPFKAIEGMLAKWEVPSLTEAHECQHFVPSY